MQITLETDSKPEDVQAVQDGLIAYNLKYAPPNPFEPLNLFIRDDAGTIKGGLLGGSAWSWMYISIFWLDESIQRQGYGTKLLQMVEEEALKRGCIGCFVDTMNFQAPEFYKKHGYTVWGTLDEFPPPNHSRIFFKKRLK